MEQVKEKCKSSMDEKLACCAGGSGSIPAVPQSRTELQYSDELVSPGIARANGLHQTRPTRLGCFDEYEILL